ncbi:Spore maturation protein A [hydrothermal vent metagenome]|uniref:Spore maturation protein A n=1 Tax=hydrothermal vent metagenome TaxID=652676 RepID=A0A3B0X119_9ZZZZ
MLNKIWAGLIITGIVFALGQDIRDEIQNTHNNGVAQRFTYLPVAHSPTQVTLSTKQVQLKARIKSPQRIQINLNNYSPQSLRAIASINGDNNGDETFINASIISKTKNEIVILFPEIHWIKLRAITNAAFDMAKFAVKLAIGLIGIMALWLGLMQIAEKSGLIKKMVRVVQPLLYWLFPNIPKDHPAFGSISMNMAANVLGLGNAATPLGIKAMQQLQALNPNKNKASDEMCMFLALNTSSVQLLPPVTLIALMGTQVSSLIIPIILATSCSTIAAVIVAKFYARRAKYRGA